MNYLKKLKIFSLALMALCVTATLSMAQQVNPPETAIKSAENFSEEEIKTFVKINKDIMPLQENIQTDMVSSIKESGLEVASFSKAGEKIMKLQEDLQVEIEEVIIKNEMSPEKFEAIYMAYNSNPEVKQKVDKLFSKDT